MVTEAIAHVKTDQDSTHMIDYEFTLYITVGPTVNITKSTSVAQPNKYCEDNGLSKEVKL